MAENRFGCPPCPKEREKPTIIRPTAPKAPTTAAPKPPRAPVPPKSGYASNNNGPPDFSAPKIPILVAPSGTEAFVKLEGYIDTGLTSHPLGVPEELAEQMGLEPMISETIETAGGRAKIPVTKVRLIIFDSAGTAHLFDDVKTGILPPGSPVLLGMEALQKFLVLIDPTQNSVGLRPI